MRADDVYRFCLMHANEIAMMAAGVHNKHYAMDRIERSLDAWTTAVAEEIVKLRDTHGMQLLHLPQA